MEWRVHKIATTDPANAAKVTTACGITAYYDGAVDGELINVYGTHRYSYAVDGQKVTCRTCQRASSKFNT
jgi:hypothetical protein